MHERSRDLSYLKREATFNAVSDCPWCGSRDLSPLATRGDGLPVSRCNECHLGFLAELPDDLSVFYDADYYERSPVPGTAPAVSGYEDYERSFSPSSFRWLSMLIRATTGPGNQKVFDLGAATGTFLEIAAYEGFECHGSELTAEGASAAQAKGLHVLPGFFDLTDWERGSFDVVTALEVLEHVTDPRTILADLSELMTDDGVLVFFVPNVTDRIISEYGDDALDFNKSFDHTLFFNPSALEHIFEEAFGPDSLTLFVADVEQWGQHVSSALGFVRKKAHPDRPERRLIDILDGRSDLDALQSDYEAIAVSLAAGKFFRDDLADAALAHATSRGASESDVDLARAQILRGRGALFDAIAEIEKLTPNGLPNADPLAGPLLNEVVVDFLTMLGIEEDGISRGLSEVHTRLDGYTETLRVLAQTETRISDLATENADLFRQLQIAAAERDRADRTLAEERDHIARLLAEERSHVAAERDRSDRLSQSLGAATEALAGSREALRTMSTAKSAAVARANTTQEQNKQLRSSLSSIRGSRAWKMIQRYRKVRTRLSLKSRRTKARTHAPVAGRPAEAPAPQQTPPLPPPEVSSYPATVSVIMPVYNKGATLGASIESVLAQTLRNVEIILWDDGSTDPKTSEALTEVSHHDQVTVFHAKNQGVIGARNSAMSYARGEFIACLDPDDLWAPTYLEKAVALLRSNPQIAVAYPWQRTGGDIEEVWKTEDLDPLVIGKANQLPVCAVFRREVYVTTGGFSPEMKDGFEDWEFWAHVADLGFKGRVIPEPLFEYCWSADAGESRDAGARAQFAALQQKIQDLHPRLGKQAHSPSSLPSAPSSLDLDPPRLPRGLRRPVLLTLPWFTVGGADRMIESLIRHWTAAGRTVVVATTLELGPGMHDRMSDLLDLTPYAYRLPSILPRDLWLDFIDRLLEALGPTTVVNVGSTWLHQNAKQIRQLHPDVRIVDQQFNTSGHVAGNIEADHAIDTTVVAYNELAEHFVEEGRNLDSIRTVFVGIDPPAPTSPEAIEALHENLGVAPDRPYVTFIGRLSEEKQPEWLPPLADALLARDTDLVVLGSGPLASALEPEFAKRKNLHWLSRMDSVEPLYAGSAVVVLPSKIEGIPLTLMESLAHGTPVVATAVGGIPELAGTPGLTLASAHDRDAWIDAVLDSLESPTENVVLPQRLSADNMAAEYDAIIDNQPAAG